MEEMTILQKLLEFAIKYSGRLRTYAVGLLLIALVATIIWSISNKNPYLAYFGVLLTLVGVILVFLFNYIITNVKNEPIRNVSIPAQVMLWTVVMFFVMQVLGTGIAMLSLMFACKPEPLRLMLGLNCMPVVTPTPTPPPTPTPTPTPTPLPSLSLKIVSPKDKEAVLAHGNKKGDAWVEVRGTLENVPPGENLRVYVFYQSADTKVGGWWYYKDSTLDQKGTWVVPHVWLGGKDKVVEGNSYNIQVIVSASDLKGSLNKLPTNTPVPDLSVFKPLASAIVNITISFVTVDS